MNIIREDEQQLLFRIYPSRYFFIVFFGFFLLEIYFLFQPEIVHWSGQIEIFNQSIPRDALYPAILAVLTLLYIISAYLFPIRVWVDKTANQITYKYFVIDPILPRLKQSAFVVTKIIPINSLTEIVYTNKIPENDTTHGLWKQPITGSTGKYYFKQHDAEPIIIYAGLFSTSTHRSACEKIAKYLKVTYHNTLTNE